MGNKNKVVLILTVISILVAISFHQIKQQFIYQKLAREVFTTSNVPVDEYMKGINFGKQVRIFKVKRGDMFIQYQVPSNLQGNFYGLPGSKPDELGISEIGYDSRTETNILKTKRQYIALKDFDVLSSYAASVVDNWSTPENEKRVGGSKVQFFTTCKECFLRLLIID
jgi:hypothetical protein